MIEYKIRKTANLVSIFSHGFCLNVLEKPIKLNNLKSYAKSFRMKCADQTYNALQHAMDLCTISVFGDAWWENSAKQEGNIS